MEAFSICLTQLKSLSVSSPCIYLCFFTCISFFPAKNMRMRIMWYFASDKKNKAKYTWLLLEVFSVKRRLEVNRLSLPALRNSFHYFNSLKQIKND